MGTQKDVNPSIYTRLEQGMFAPLPQLHSVLVRHTQDVVGLNLKCRGEGDWIAVLRRYGPDGAPQVCFGTGYDILGALLALEGTVAADRWREDKPWKAQT